MALNAPTLSIAGKGIHVPGKIRGSGPSPVVSIALVGSAGD